MDGHPAGSKTPDTVIGVASTKPHLRPVGDRAILVDFGSSIDEATIDRVLALDQALSADGPTGLVELAPAMTSLLVVFDPVATDHRTVAAAIEVALSDRPALRTGGTPTTHHLIDVCYHRTYAPDLELAAELLGVDPADVAATHRSGTYRVAMYGFAPGYAYLFGTPGSIDVPRRPTPGPTVPAGSVIITGRQCLVTPVPMSTGWYAIGCSPTPVLTTDPDRPFRFEVGDSVEFREIDVDEMAARSGTVS